ncbi:MAG: hypothetical protein IPJ88_17700 [Myxococcales bacterium]|nr:MAG: hypothetical protein IPJ88_17700 [Myxococcales bacterium]
MRLKLQGSARQIATMSLGLLVLVIFTACDDDNGSKVGPVVGFSDIPAGDVCAYGGVLAQAGNDSNANGILDEGEVETSQNLCNGFAANGTSGSGLLMTSTSLSSGDANCPNGGTMVVIGIDSGDMDGELTGDEIATTDYVCNGNGSFVTPSLLPPSGPEGDSVIDLHGADGSTTNGGNGGYFGAAMNDGSLGGHIKIFKTGSVDASFEFPETVSTNLGEVPLQISTDTTLPNLADGSTLSEGEAFIKTSNNRLYIRQSSSDVIVTGVHVASGATLTLELNYTSYAYFYLDNDFFNEGTISTTVIGATKDRGGLRIYCETYYGTSSSSVDLRGEDGTTGEDGGNGGWLDIEAYVNEGIFINQGNINLSGGQGDQGGNAGWLYVYSDSKILNSGNVAANGGAGNVTNGGSANEIEFDAYFGHAYNSGNLSANGGTGLTYGGSGDTISLYNEYAGHVRNSGMLSANGGSVNAACTTTCSGGSAGYIGLYAYGGEVLNSGNVSAIGGTGTTGSGGSGGYFELYTSNSSGWEGSYQPGGNIEVAGELLIYGGAGASGGSGGGVEAHIDASNTPAQQEIIFYGYASLNMAGGNGASNGGAGGYLEWWHDTTDGNSWPADGGPSGGVVNYLPVDLSGGNGADGAGGSGGYFYMYTEDEYGFDTDSEVVINYGDVDCSGGDGTDDGGYGGYVYMWGYNHAENQGDIIAHGGSASADNGSGNSGYYIGIFSDLGPAINSGNLDFCGGDATADGGSGGSGGYVEIIGYSASNSGNVGTCGGDGNASNGSGGDGNDFHMLGLYEASSNTADTINVTGGAGDSPGESGQAYIDNQNVTDTL